MKKKGLYLSHSQINTFKSCERLWYIERVERLRPKYISSALIMGAALDSAVEEILLDYNRKKKKNLDPKKVFLEKLDNFEVNRKPKKLPEDLLAVKFFASNIDEKFLKEVDLKPDFKRLGIEPIEVAGFLDYCKQQRKAKEKLDETEQLLFNTLAYRTMQSSGLMFIETLQEWIEENVAEVHEVQKKIEIDDGAGNKFVGYLDFIVTLKDKDCETCGGSGYFEYCNPPTDIENAIEEDFAPELEPCEDCNPKKLLIDLKTSSNVNLYYPEGCASNSPQLGIYAQEEGLFNVAYLIIDKKVRQREPRIRLHFIEGEITEEFLDQVFDEIEDIVEKIIEKKKLGKGAFETNKESCSNFGGCAYFNYCWKGKKDDLEKV